LTQLFVLKTSDTLSAGSVEKINEKSYWNTELCSEKNRKEAYLI